jgi:hypothetical protein
MYRRPNGLEVEYSIDSLADYLLCSGHFVEPETRLPFSDTDLARLDGQIKQNKLVKPSVLEAKLFRDWEGQHFRDTALQGLDRIIGEIMTRLLEMIEAPEPIPNMQMHLLNELHTVADYYTQMRSVDRANAETCLEMHLQYLRGPKNKPTTDRHGLLRMTSDFFRAIMSSPLFLLQGGGGGLMMEEDEEY